jgi:hypothetical protein
VLDLGGGKGGHGFVDDEAADPLIGHRPDHGQIGKWRRW